MTLNTHHTQKSIMKFVSEICQSTNHGSMLQNVIECLESGKWYESNDDKTMDIFSRLREKINVSRSSNESVLFHDNRLIIPKKLQKKVHVI